MEHLEFVYPLCSYRDPRDALPGRRGSSQHAVYLLDVRIILTLTIELMAYAHHRMDVSIVVSKLLACHFEVKRGWGQGGQVATYYTLNVSAAK